MKIAKRKILNFTFLICLGLLLNLLELVTISKVCEYPEHGPHYYGFPRIYRTNMTWVNSGSGVIYIFNWLVNIAFWIIVSVGAWSATKKLFNLRIRFPKLIMIIVIFISITYQILGGIALDLEFEFFHDVKLNYYEQEIHCNSKIIFFNFGSDAQD